MCENFLSEFILDSLFDLVLRFLASASLIFKFVPIVATTPSAVPIATAF